MYQKMNRANLQEIREWKLKIIFVNNTLNIIVSWISIPYHCVHTLWIFSFNFRMQIAYYVSHNQAEFTRLWTTVSFNFTKRRVKVRRMNWEPTTHIR